MRLKLPVSYKKYYTACLEARSCARIVNELEEQNRELRENVEKLISQNTKIRQALIQVYKLSGEATAAGAASYGGGGAGGHD